MSIKMSLVYYLKRGLTIILDYLAVLVGYLSEPKRGLFILPPITDPILLQSAATLAQKIKTGEYKSELVVKAYIERIKEVEPYVNAFTHKRFEAALVEAKEIDRKIAEQLEGQTNGSSISLSSMPLLGVPFTGKDSIPVRGLYLTGGLLSRKSRRATEDADCVKKIKEAGAICLGMTNIPEACFWWDSDNKLFGRTNNPYDLSRIPGGSSGGQAAAISYGGSVWGTGGDIGGSIRLPSYFCGIFGHKPTPGIVSTNGHFPAVHKNREPFLSLGPMCRYASDLVPMLKIMAGEEAINRLLPNVASNAEVDFRKIKIYYMDESGDPSQSPVDPEIKSSIAKVAKHFHSTYGTETRKICLEKFKNSLDIYANGYFLSDAVPLAEVLADGGNEINIAIEYLKLIFGFCKHTLPALIVATIEKFWIPDPEKIALSQELKKELHLLLGKNGILLYPTQPEVAPKHKTTILKFFNPFYASIFNIFEVPITQCPLGLNGDGLPLGLQVIGGPFNDHLTLAIASEIEKKFGGWVPPCRVEISSEHIPPEKSDA